MKDLMRYIPVVIVGKDRTRMTCAVIDHIREHLKGAKPYFICVSDRSRQGHDKVVEGHLRSSGAEQFEVLRTIPEENRIGWGAAMNIGLECAFDVCADASFALVVDNDWLLNRDLDIEKYEYAFRYSPIGSVTFKSVNPRTNVALSERKMDDGSVFYLREKKDNGEFSFSAEIGCMLMTKHMWKRCGGFRENCVTDETEIAFCRWYNSLSPSEREESGLWFATDKDLFHAELNGENHVFTHVGIVSQHPGPHQWDCPDEYKHLSDDKADEMACKGAEDGLPGGVEVSCPPPVSDESEIRWENYFDRVYCMHYLPQKNKLPRLKSELARVGLLDSPVFEFRYTSECRYDIDVCNSHKGDVPLLNQSFVNIILEVRRILEEAIFFNYSRILLMENDVAFLKDISLVRRILDATPEDIGLVQYDKFVNDGPATSIYNDICEHGRINEFFAEYREGVFRSAACFSLDAAAIRELKGLIDVEPDAPDTYFQRMSCRKAIAVKNLAIQVFSKGSWSVATDGVDYMHKVYKNGNVKYEDYNLPLGYTYGSLYDGEETMTAHRKFISVYAIAKNEASVAERWYECVKEADEVCVLDTGSTDGTVDILRRLGAKVTVKTYEDWSFAVARNDSMKLVSPKSEILFTLDLDEVIEPGWRKRLEDAWIAEEEKGNRPVGVNYKYVWALLPNGQEAMSFSIRKVHANGCGVWRYRCHELLCGLDGYEFFLDGFVVVHKQNKETDRSKYLPLLEKDAKEMPDDDRSAYYYARELKYLGRNDEAIVEFKRHLGLRSSVWRAERASSMRNIALCYRARGDLDACELWLWRSAEEDPGNREATFLLGDLAMERKDYKSAVVAFSKCVAIKERSLEYASAPEVWSHLPWFLYAQSLWWTGDWDGAVEASRVAAEISPANEEAGNQYRNMLATRDRFRGM